MAARAPVGVDVQPMLVVQGHANNTRVLILDAPRHFQTPVMAAGNVIQDTFLFVIHMMVQGAAVQDIPIIATKTMDAGMAPHILATRVAAKFYHTMEQRQKAVLAAAKQSRQIIIR